MSLERLEFLAAPFPEQDEGNADGVALTSEAQRALVVPGAAQLLDRGGVEAVRSIGNRAGRYLGGIAAALGLGTIGVMLGARVLVLAAAVALPATVVGPMLVFLARRGVRFARAGRQAIEAFRMARNPLRLDVSDVREGEWVHTRGHVLAGPSFTSAGGRARAVLASYVGIVGRLRPPLRTLPRWELHGLDFTIALAGGQRVRVEVSGARYLGRPCVMPADRLEGRPLATRNTDLEGTRVASVYDEDVVAVGDEVEILGFLRRAVDPGAESGYRGARLLPVLAGSAPWSLVIRKTPT